MRFAVVNGESKLAIDLRSSLHGINVQTTDLSGFVEAEAEGDRLVLEPMPTLRFSAPIQGLRSGNDFQDREMHRLIGGRGTAEIVGELRDLKPLPEPQRYLVRGTIALKGVAKPYESEATIRIDGGRITLDGERVMDMRDFGINPPRLLLFQVFPEFKVTLHLVATAEGGRP